MPPQKVSIKYEVGAIILFDFKAAFPSLDQDFMWDVLETFGIPVAFVNALKLFYKDNTHILRHGTYEATSITVRSGVRQGCPLSPILSAICSDVLLQTLAETLEVDDCLHGFADDTGLVVSEYIKAMPHLSRTFEEYALISALDLNVKKTVFIPLWPTTSLSNVRKLLRELCPRWRDIAVDWCAKYLGFSIGPGSVTKSWQKPLAKYQQRADTWSRLNLGLHLNTIVYKPFVASVLGFVWQLEAHVPESLQIFEKVL